MPDDILAALQELDFDDMTMRLNQILLGEFRIQYHAGDDTVVRGRDTLCTR